MSKRAKNCKKMVKMKYIKLHNKFKKMGKFKNKGKKIKNKHNNKNFKINPIKGKTLQQKTITKN